MQIFFSIMVFGSIIWMGFDASKRDFSRSRLANKTWQWIVGGLFLWIVFFPLYLSRRGAAPLKSVDEPY